VAGLTKFVQSLSDDALQNALAFRKQDHAELPLVQGAGCAAHIASGLKTIDQTHGTVMAKQQALGKPADAGLTRIGKSADSQEHLILLRFEAGGHCRLVTAAEKLANTIAELSQSGIFTIRNLPAHPSSLS
jgi:hypothetical protein